MSRLAGAVVHHANMPHLAKVVQQSGYMSGQGRRASSGTWGSIGWFAGERATIWLSARRNGEASTGNAEFDALFIPGGYSPDHLRADNRMVAFARAFFNPDRPVFAICHGPQILMTARVVHNRRMTAWKTIQDDLHQVGADVLDQEVVVDGNLVTSRQPADIPAFNRACLAVLDRVLAPAG